MYNIILLSVYRSILEYELDLEKEKKRKKASKNTRDSKSVLNKLIC